MFNSVGLITKFDRTLIDPDEVLMIPGPTTLSSRVRAAMALPQQSHVSPEFYNEFKESLELSRFVFGNTSGLQFLITGSGTIGMETAVVSLFEPGDNILALETGYFGHRFATLAEIHGCHVRQVESPLGKRIDVDLVEKEIRSAKYKAVLFTHVDTSTSVMNDIAAISKLCQENGLLSLCDSVCGVAGARLVFDDLGADVVLTGSQKAIAGPPGATLLAVSESAFATIEKRKSPIQSYYMNLLRWKPVMDDPKIYLTTPAVQVMLGVREALLEIKEEGLEQRWERHRRIANALVAGLEALDLKPCPDEESRSPTVTAFYVENGKSAEIQEALRSRFGIHVARGFGDYKDTMLRVGHFGNISERNLISFLGALELTLGKSRTIGESKAVESAMPLLR
jgi:alanine-glyoxylate transaminase / serine-glyoxylate transaminase / serine-pyruvate transaminase